MHAATLNLFLTRSLAARVAKGAGGHALVIVRGLGCFRSH